MPTKADKPCATCGATIFGDSPRGLCSICLFRVGLEFGENDDGDVEHHRSQSPPLTEFGDYALIEEIGRGAQGVVYRALQKSLNRIVAIKVIGLGRWSATPHLRRFRHEAEAAAHLEHQLIVPIYEIGERDGSCYFSMKFIEGGQLDKMIGRQPMPARRAAELLAKIARTVQFAHEHGILHRDIKPGNILLDRQGEPHLTDFGLARLVEQESTITNSFDVLGTPSYMAPEQAAGRAKELSPLADVYSLGAVFYQMLTGQPPFAGGSTYETIRLVLDAEPRNPRLLNPKLDVDLATVCLKCLEKDPAKRYQSAEALAQDVERWLRYEPINARPAGALERGAKWLRRNPASALAAVSLIALLATLGALLFKSGILGGQAKSIAVLPFENLAGGEANSELADGIQDDILTKLAKVGALKVISRTSVMQFRGPRNIREIGNLLGVSHVVEGSVRRTGNRVHLDAQLIDTRTDAHVWAEEYDRDLIDVFAIQSEIAQKIAEQLHAKITPAEKQAIERPPTADLTAFDLFNRAKDIFLRVSYSNSSKEDLLKAANLLDQAVARDPSFFEAYCQLAWVHDFLYIVGHDHSPARLALAEAAIRSAFRLQPDAGEAHLARAENLYRGHLDYNAALAELEIAGRTLPNESRVFELRGYIQRRQGKQEEALRSLQRAMDLDPRNIFTLQQIANSYILLQRYADAKLALKRALAIDPNDADLKGADAWIDLEWRADPRPLHRVLDSIRETHSVPAARMADGLLICALAERDPAAARAALVAADQNTAFNDESVHFSRSFVEGLIARMAHDENAAEIAFTHARDEHEQLVQAQLNYGPSLCVLGLIDAALGRKEDALRETQRAVDLVPVEKDALNGPLMLKYQAMTAAWVGDKDLACKQLEAAIRYRGTISYGYLKLLPFWDPLRGDPHFEKIVTSLAPK